jgi:hypothetical protein
VSVGSALGELDGDEDDEGAGEAGVDEGLEEGADGVDVSEVGTELEGAGDKTVDELVVSLSMAATGVGLANNNTTIAKLANKAKNLFSIK